MTAVERLDPNVDSMLEHALGYGADGARIFPANPANKRPFIKAPHDLATIDAEQIRAWWTRWPNALIAVRVADDMLVIDVDPKHRGDATWDALGGDDIASALRHASGRNDGGRHHWYWRPANFKPSTVRLNAWARERGLGEATEGDGWTAGIDVLTSSHRYSIVPPSLHPDTGQAYWWDAEGAPDDLPAILVELLSPPEPKPPRPTKATSGLGHTALAGETPADWFTRTAEWADILAGWTLVDGDGESDQSLWKHPTATAESSASIRHGCLFSYSTNLPFETTGSGDPHGYTKFHAYAILRHGGDLAEAASTIRRTLMPQTSSLGMGTTGTQPPADAPEENSSPDDDGGGIDEAGARIEVFKDLPADYRLQPLEWLVRGLIAKDTHGEIGGAQKTLKSYIGTTIGVGIALGRPVLDRFEVPERRRVVLIVGEGGERMLLARLHRMCGAYGAAWADLRPWLRYSVVSAPITSPAFAQAIADEVEAFDPGYVNIDPWYVYGGGDANASQLGEIGDRLEQVPRIVGPDRALLINHHLNQTGVGTGLVKLAGAGHAEWVDSWLILTHRTPPRVEAGEFRLGLDVGSRQWGGAAFNVDYDIGRFDIETGMHDGDIQWKVTTNDRGAGASAGDGTDAKVLAAEVNVVNAWKKRRDQAKRPWTITEWIGRTVGTDALNRLAFHLLVDGGRIVCATDDPDARGAKWALSEGQFGL